jgi:hypothetical protein
MPNVNLICQICGATARRPLTDGPLGVGSRGVHETPSEDAKCPKGHGQMVREDGRRTVKEAEIRLANYYAKKAQDV